MQDTYSDFHHDPQAQDLVPVELSFDEILVADKFWRHREPDTRETIAARNAVLFAYEEGAIGATEALCYLEKMDLFGDVEFFLEAFSEGVRALSSRPYPSPTSLPPAAPGARSTPSEYLLEVLAPVRERRIA